MIACVYVAIAFIFHSPGRYPNNFLGDPTIGLVGLLAIGLVAGALAQWTGTGPSSGWAVAMSSSAIAFFLAANLWVLEPTVFHVTRPEFIAAVGLRLAAGCTAMFLPAHQASGAPWELDPTLDYPEDSVGSLAPGTAIWSCGNVKAVMTVH